MTRCTFCDHHLIPDDEWICEQCFAKPWLYSNRLISLSTDQWWSEEE